MTDICYDILRESSADSTAYPLSLMQLFCNSAQQDILGGRIVHPFTKQEATAGDLHFLNSDAYYYNVEWSYTTADLTIGETSILADTTDFPTSGFLYLGWQVVSYSSITTTSFDWVPATWSLSIKFPFIAGTMISIAFELPSDFGWIQNVIYNNKIKLPPKAYDDMFEDLNNYKGSNFQRNKVTSIYESPYKVKPFYTVKDAKYLIVYQFNETGIPIHLRYHRMAPMMTNTVDCTIDNDIYAKATIPYLAVAEMLFNRWEEKRAGDLYNVAISRVSKMYSRYNDTVYESQNGVTYSLWKWKLNI